ncbi:MAG TPA: trigger factor [Clostridiales bacterium]|nr:trigger factor [Clostridiales bacterium]
MSLLKKELTEKSGFTMEFSVSKDVYDKAEMEAYKKLVKNMTVPGFRKGKAPKHVVERLYGKGVFFEDAVNACLPEAFDEAVKEAGLEVVGTPNFEIVSNDGDIVLKATGFVKPEVKIDGYKGIKAKKKTVRVTKKDVDEELDKARKRNARTVDVSDRAAKKGDIANIDYEGSVDGVPFDGGKAEKHDLTLGSGAFIPGFEDQIVGKKPGEEFDVEVTFPADYHAKDLAGKKAVFKTKLNTLKVEELPAADDEFAKDVSEFNTLDEYKADLKDKITKRESDKADAEFENLLGETLIDKLVADIPEPMFVQETENYVRDYDNRLRMQGLDLNTYFKYTGLTLDALRTQMRPQAEKQVKLRLALEKIAELEKLTVSDDAVEAEYKRISDAYNVPMDKVKEMVAAEDIRKDLLVADAMKFVKDHALAEKADDAAEAPAAEEKPAKKATKKAAAKSEEAEEKKPAAKTTKKAAAKSEETEEKKPAAKTTKKAAAKSADAEEKKPAKKTTKKAADKE